MRNLATCRLACTVACGHMSNFVRHDAGQFSLVVGFQNESRVHEEETSRESEGVHFFRIQNFDREGDFGVGVPHQVLAYPVHIFRNNRVVNQLGLPLDLLRQLFANRNLLLE